MKSYNFIMILLKR